MNRTQANHEVFSKNGNKLLTRFYLVHYSITCMEMTNYETGESQIADIRFKIQCIIHPSPLSKYFQIHWNLWLSLLPLLVMWTGWFQFGYLYSAAVTLGLGDLRMNNAVICPRHFICLLWCHWYIAWFGQTHVASLHEESLASSYWQIFLTL